MAQEIEIQNLDGTAVNTINLGQITPGTVKAAPGNYRIKTNSAVSYDDLRLTALIGTRVFDTAGNVAEGSEVISEKWLEASVNGGAYTPIGGNPNVSGNYIAISKPAVSASVTLDLRLNPPSTMDAIGDFYIILDLFYKVG